MSQPTYPDALEVLRSLRQAGHTAYLAGGCVRDRLRGVEPKDFDIASSATPAEVQALFPHTEAVGAAFGVILVIHQGAAYEVASFRKDGAYADGRRPTAVSAASPEEDAQRRDFTVNGLFYDPEQDQVLDFVDGLADLKAGLLRAIGEPKARFAEDQLRVLRCVRFACQLGFKVDPATWEGAKALAPQVPGLAMERIMAELTKLLQSPEPRRGLELLHEAGLIQLLLPELLPMQGCAQPPQFHPEGDVWEHTLRTVQAVSDAGPPSAALAWAGLLHDMAKPATFTNTDRIRFHGHEAKGKDMALALLGRLKSGNELKQAVATLVGDHLCLVPIKQMKLSTLKRLLRRDDIDELLALHRADVLASHGDLELYDLAKAKKAELEALQAEAGLRPQPLVSGADLIAWGYAPGPAFKAILSAVEDEQLEGGLSGAEAARAYVEGRFKKP